MNKEKAPSQTAWYTEDGPATDVVLSSRVRFARNLSGFLFPIVMKSDDAEHVLSLVFDGFNHLETPDEYQMIRMSQLDANGKQILSERGIIDTGSGMESWRGVIMRNDGVLSATVNIDDHIRIVSFSPGLSLYECSKSVSGIDTVLQQYMQFAAAPDFGYLTSDILNVGSGMKASVLVCLPGLCMTGLIDRVIKEYLSQGFMVRGYYGSTEGTSMGGLYLLSNASAARGDVHTQIEQMEQASGKLADLERKSRKELANSMMTSVEDAVFRAIVTAKYARFISLTESLELLQRVKLGLSLGLITGLEHKDITALLYRIKPAHMGFVISAGSITMEKDIKTDEMRLDRLRAMIIQEVFKEADIHERR